MKNTDLIVVIPGIMGSTLVRDGREIWSSRPGSLMKAITTVARDIRDLELPEGIGDDSPNDGVKPGTLMPSMHVLPGIWSLVEGYEPLVDMLRRVGFVSSPTKEKLVPNLLVFPYDWRLSNRFNAKVLKGRVESALQRWRESSPENGDAKVTFVCHSMGGLVARWYVYKEGGAEVTNKIITLGTPYRGSINALDNLVNGPFPWLSKIGVSFHQFARSLPSIYQLLPTYACVEGSEGLDFLASRTVPTLSTDLVADAGNFYRDIEAAEMSDPGYASRRHAIIGVKQATMSTVVLSNGELKFLTTYDGDDHGGDGTVPVASGPKNVPANDNSIRRVADKHGGLQRNRAALDEIESVVTATRMIYKSAECSDIRVSVPELIRDSDVLTMEVQCEREIQPLIVTIKDEREAAVEQVNATTRGGLLRFEAGNLAPGGYTVEVSGPPIGPRVSSVRSPFLVWPGSAH